MAQRWLAVLIRVLALTLATNAAALTLPGVPTASVEQDPDEPIRVGADASDDAAIAARLQEVFDQLPNLERAEISVNAGVVRLSGAAPTAAAIAQAEDIARRVDGVVAVRNEIEAEADVAMRLRPAVETLEQRLRALIAAAPLILLALAVVAISILLAWLLGRWKRLWRKKGRSGFIGDLATRTIQFIVVGVGVVLALVVLDATALLTATLGAAGLLGLAVGFALRDMIENTIASILLSLRQPFRPRDLVLINDYEGFVVRLTSRATILLTLDGNHVRIPNSDVFKATIVNYTRNPERRLTVELGLAVENDSIAAIEAGALALKELDFVLEAAAARRTCCQCRRVQRGHRIVGLDGSAHARLSQVAFRRDRPRQAQP